MSKKIHLPDKKGKMAEFTLYTVDEVVMENLCLFNDSSLSYKGSYVYYESYNAFDIETSTLNKDLAWMYAFMLSFFDGTSYILIMGRRWKEFRVLLDYMAHYKYRKVLYVHNLAFEWQFIYTLFNDCNIEMFAVSKRRPVRVYIKDYNLEFRCSWKLTNMSLYYATRREIGIDFWKDDDVIDYGIMRYPDTILTEKEIEYNMLDVVSLSNLIYRRMINYDDTIASIPYTSTGYIRRDCRRRTYEVENYYEKYVQGLAMDETIYGLLKDAGRGGNTHANRYFVSAGLDL